MGAAQVHCLMKIENLSEKVENEDHKKQLDNVEHMKKLKKVFIRFATEELLRRGNANQGDEIIGEEKISEQLFSDHDKFVKNVFARREAEIMALHQVNPNDTVDAFQ